MQPITVYGIETLISVTLETSQLHCMQPITVYGIKKQSGEWSEE